jgi:hypothetical protein
VSALLTPNEIKALASMLEYAQGEHGKSQGGYFSAGGWCGHTLQMLLDRARVAPETSPQLPEIERLREVERDNAWLRKGIEFWIDDGRLQTFEDREQFRHQARLLLGQRPADETSPQLSEAETLLQAWADLLPPNGQLYWEHVGKARDYFKRRAQKPGDQS